MMTQPTMQSYRVARDGQTLTVPAADMWTAINHAVEQRGWPDLDGVTCDVWTAEGWIAATEVAS